MSNAVKFTSSRAEARIEIGDAPGGNNKTVIFVRDNGVGFDPHYAAKLFGVLPSWSTPRPCHHLDCGWPWNKG